MVSTITTILIIAFLVFFCLALVFDASILFSQVNPVRIITYEPAKVVRVDAGSFTLENQTTHGVVELIVANGNYSLESIEFEINDAFNPSNNSMYFTFNNFTQIEFFDAVTNKGLSMLNETKKNNYIQNNLPDLVIKSPLIEGNYLPLYTQLLFSSSIPSNVKCNSFLTRTSFDTWEGEYFFDDGGSGYYLNTTYRDSSYVSTNASKILWSVFVPDSFQPPDNMPITMGKGGGFWVKQETAYDQVFHLTVKDKNSEQTKNWWGLVGIIGTPSTLFGTLLSLYIERTNTKHKGRRR